jgi:hypothetical protein
MQQISKITMRLAGQSRPFLFIMLATGALLVAATRGFGSIGFSMAMTCL